MTASYSGESYVREEGTGALLPLCHCPYFVEDSSPAVVEFFPLRVPVASNFDIIKQLGRVASGRTHGHGSLAKRERLINPRPRQIHCSILLHTLRQFLPKNC
jgi:hypothetical protein